VQQPQLIARDLFQSFRIGSRRIEVLRGISIEVAYDGDLKLTVPGQPVYTLLADSPTRFRMTGANVPAGFFLEYEMANGVVKTVKLIQPAPRPTLTLLPKR